MLNRLADLYSQATAEVYLDFPSHLSPRRSILLVFDRL